MNEEQYIEAMEQAYQVYAKTRELYEQLMKIETDSYRIRVLERLLSDLNEENK